MFFVSLRLMARAAIAPMFLLLALPGTAAAEDCPRSPALSEAAADLLLDGETRSAGVLRRVVHRSGSDAPTVHALELTGEAPDEARARKRKWLAGLARDRAAPLMCGEARSANGHRLVLAVPDGGDIDVPSEARRLLRIRVKPPFRRPRLVVRDARGVHRRIRVKGEGAERTVKLPERLQWPVHVQLVAVGPQGPRPIAERTLSEDGNAGPGSAGAPARWRSAAGFDPRSRLRRLRQAQDVTPLRSNRLLTRAAQRHARRVCREDEVAHELEGGDDPESRLAHVGLKARIVGEVIARAGSEDEALDDLVNSPSHLMTMTDDRLTDGGWGKATDDEGRTCVVGLFAAWPQPRAR